MVCLGAPTPSGHPDRSFELTNKYGAVIAATIKPEAYDEPSVAWWKSANANRTYPGDVALSGDARITGLTVAVAMTNLSGNFTGTPKTVLTADDLIRSSLRSSTRYNTSEPGLSQGTERFLCSKSDCPCLPDPCDSQHPGRLSDLPVDRETDP